MMLKLSYLELFIMSTINCPDHDCFVFSEKIEQHILFKNNVPLNAPCYKGPDKNENLNPQDSRRPQNKISATTTFRFMMKT